MSLKYNEKAAALTWEIVNDKEDIGEFEILYNDKIIKGKGFKEFLSAATKLSKDITVIYVKYLKWFLKISLSFIDYTGKDFFANGELNFYHARISDNVEVRNWDNFWSKIDDKKKFLKRLEFCRINYRCNCKGKLGLEKHFKYTLAKDMWDDIKCRYFLYQAWARDFCERMIPKTKNELYTLESLNKASFYYCNETHFNCVSENVHCYDLSSSHLSILARKDFPCDSFQLEDDIKEIKRVIEEKKESWYCCMRFIGLESKINFPIDLRNFGIKDKDGSWILSLTNVDMKWFTKVFKWKGFDIFNFYHAPQAPLSKGYAEMFKDLYDWKKSQKKGTFGKEICKFRAELPFGQPMKKTFYYTKAAWSETEQFHVVRNGKPSLEQINHKIVNRGIPMQVSYWVAAYSRVEEFEMLYRIGLENVLYGDTDSVKFIGEEGLEIIKKRNDEIEKEFAEVGEKRCFTFDQKLGLWCDEGTVDYFKAIGIKWYMTRANGEIEVKAAGADVDVLKECLENVDNPLIYFDMRMNVKGLFKDISPSKIKKNAVVFTYRDKIGLEMQEEILSVVKRKVC